jgi:hypothetical protein
MMRGKVKRIGLYLIGGVIGLLASVLAIGVIVGPPPADEKPVAAVSAPQMAATNPALPSANEIAQEELLTVLRQASLASNSCKFAIEATVDLLGTAGENPDNLMKAYSRADLGEPDCDDAVRDLGQIDRLKLATQVMTNNLDFALNECARAAKLRAEALKTVKVALDGDYSFATAQKFKDAVQDARTTHNLCIGSLKALGADSGLAADSLSFLDA